MFLNFHGYLSLSNYISLHLLKTTEMSQYNYNSILFEELMEAFAKNYRCNLYTLFVVQVLLFIVLLFPCLFILLSATFTTAVLTHLGLSFSGCRAIYREILVSLMAPN